ncbi:LytR/AlgR family response regulator transcription factor [Sphingobacterium paucimobilis]|uniref:Response regulatory domain-containing protein n=1 Tax=Sphingobacterium paucimobilis HER1398 TaxID=1346330 RepID=U2J4T5_9SPHI|nr:LytTR family DNA-binding domain-containing protein [Sphingobacterium paucimobilis]ERJ57668.1 hypothetical protein M472_02695 [Sphingobacterium paucimobilis HER1398]
MYKTIIVEDEYHLREALSILLEMVAPDKIQVIGYAEDIVEAVRIIDRLKPDLVFMDIMLKRGTGFDVLNQVAYKDFQLVITTAYEEHAVRAFKFNALDYLLKPIDSQELEEAIDRLADQAWRKISDTQLEHITADYKVIPDRIILPTQEAMHVVKVDNIVRCETSGSYTTFMLVDGKNIIVSKPLKHYEEILALPKFMRIHQSHLINLHYIVSYSREGMVQMCDGTSIPISRANKEMFFKQMKPS